MSHASVLVAIDPTELKAAKNNIETAVQYQMAPFDEQDKMFKDGSRWDWWTIGGRYTQRLSESDICLRSNVDLVQLQQKNMASCRVTYAEAQQKPEHAHFIYGVDPAEETLNNYLARICGKPEQSASHYAFLRNRHWHERERLGWFGGSTATECERHAETADVETMIRRCKHKDAKTGASIVVWNEPWEIWSIEFWKRFVEPLKPDTTLITVDYHV